MYPIFLEEVQTLLGEDVGNCLNRGRKYGCPLIMTAHGIESLCNRFVDIVDTVLNDTGTVIALQQRTKPNLDELSVLLWTRMLNFQQKFKPMDRPDGYGILTLPEYGEQHGIKTGKTTIEGCETGCGTKEETAKGWSFGVDSQQAQEVGKTRSVTDREQHTDTNQTSDRSGVEFDGEIEHFMTGSERSSTNANTKGKDTAIGDNQSFKQAQGQRKGIEAKRINGSSKSRSVKKAVSNETSHFSSRSVNNRNHLLPLHRTEYYPEGLLYSVDEQFWMVKQILQRLDIGEALICSLNYPTAKITIPYLGEPFEGLAKLKHHVVEGFLRWMHSIHPFFFVPQKQRKWIGKLVMPSSGDSSRGKSRRSRSGSKQKFSPVTKLLRDEQGNSKNENGGNSDTSAESS